MQTIKLFWFSLKCAFDDVKNASGLKIFLDEMRMAENKAEHLICQKAKTGNKESVIIKKLVDKGAEIMQTEDSALIRKFNVLRQKIGKAKDSKIMKKYSLECDGLLKERDAFIAKTITASLNPIIPLVLISGLMGIIVCQKPHAPTLVGGF